VLLSVVMVMIRNKVSGASTDNGSPLACAVQKVGWEEREDWKQAAFTTTLLNSVHHFQFSHREKVDDPQ